MLLKLIEKITHEWGREVSPPSPAAGPPYPPLWRRLAAALVAVPALVLFWWRSLQVAILASSTLHSFTRSGRPMLGINRLVGAMQADNSLVHNIGSDGYDNARFIDYRHIGNWLATLLIFSMVGPHKQERV